MEMKSDDVEQRIAAQFRKMLKKPKTPIWRAGFTMVDIKGVEIGDQIEPPGHEWQGD